MNINKTIKNIRFKIFKWLLFSIFKPEIKENVMRKYYVSYMIINPQSAMPIYGDTFVDIDGKLTDKSINDIKKSLVDGFNKQNNFRIPTGVRVVLTQICDITKEENDNALKEINKENTPQNNKFGKDYFMPGVIEIVNGEKYVGGKKEDLNERTKEV